jgi:hypothetical protein
VQPVDVHGLGIVIHVNGPPRGRVEEPDRVDARIGAEHDREAAAAGKSHGGHPIRRDLTLEWRAFPRRLGFRPVERGEKRRRELIVACRPRLADRK